MLIDIKPIKEQIQHEVLENGLHVYIYDNKDLVEFNANYVTFFGSNDLEFELEDKTVTLPHGIAHFLEHVMFAMEDGDAFTKFADNLASPNAYTSYTQTSYIFSCFSNFEENLKNLIKMVQTPYFTDQLVKKEMNIITEEIKMYSQIPEWNIRNYTFNGVCNVTNYGIDIAGDEKSIQKITTKYLLDIFNKFYIPSNQALIIGGNFKNMDILNLIKSVQIIKENKEKPKVKKLIEDDKVMLPERIYFNDKISNTIATYTFKFPIKEDKFKNLEDYFILNCFANAYFTENTDAFQDALESKTINQSFGFHVHVTNDIKILSFEMTIENDDSGFKSFCNRDIKIDKKEFENAYKCHVASELRAINNRRNLVDQISSILVDEITINEYYNTLFSLDLKEAIQRCNQMITSVEKFYCSICKK
ncbi:MAG: EF-P 5-aminopentanol modification-associated protein YfmH [Mycoplasmatales bacterium]